MFSLLLTVPSCIYSFWHGVIPTSYFIFNDFYACFTNFYPGLALTVARGEIRTSVYVHTRMRIVILRAKQNGSCDMYVQSR